MVNDAVINSLAPGECGCDFKFVTFKLVSRKDILSISNEIDPGDFRKTSMMIRQYSSNGLVLSGNKLLNEPSLLHYMA